MILYRIAKEVIINVRKHAQATNTLIVLYGRDAGYGIRVTDDGIGFDSEQITPVPGHVGLASMRERAELVGGWLNVESAPDSGTTVEFWIPSSFAAV